MLYRNVDGDLSFGEYLEDRKEYEDAGMWDLELGSS
jgi:hypothetical protein